MAKQTKASKAPVTPVPAPVTPRGRGRAYTPESRITIVTGEEARRVVQNLSCHRALQAMTDAKGKARTVGEYVAAFGPECDKKPLPGRAGQPGATQAAGILRFLEREGAVTVQVTSK